MERDYAVFALLCAKTAKETLDGVSCVRFASCKSPLGAGFAFGGKTPAEIVSKIKGHSL